MKLKSGSTVPVTSFTTIHGKKLAIPNGASRYVHLQFRRFAGCPVCNFHLHRLGKRHEEIEAAGIREVIFFHSSREEMLKYQDQLPFDCVADPDKKYYRQFGVETSIFAPFHPAVFWNGLRGILATGKFYKKAENGIFGLPADFLISPDGRVLAAHYGKHADDHWDADELLRLALASEVRAGSVGHAS
jgi:peroxiredoxin